MSDKKKKYEHQYVLTISETQLGQTVSVSVYSDEEVPTKSEVFKVLQETIYEMPFVKEAFKRSGGSNFFFISHVYFLNK